MSSLSTTEKYNSLFTGIDVNIPLLNGNQDKYVNLDNAASTPAFKVVQETIMNFLEYYSSVHRGTGFKSQLSTHAFEESRKTVMDFVGADPQIHTCVFGKNTTESINELSHRFPFTPKRNIVLTSGMEHHSNDLPWRAVARTIHVNLTKDGHLDQADFDSKLTKYADQIALVAITGASNVTGYLNPIHRLAEKTHAVGAQIIVDCAQLAPHRKIEMRPINDPTHLDYVALSAHKLYAPFGTGALIGLSETFQHGDPTMRGGGTVEIVTLSEVVWADPPEREEAGSPNTVGAIALASAINQLEAVGFEKIISHEAGITAYALSHLSRIPGLHLYGDVEPDHVMDRLGVIPFNLANHSHFHVAAILGYEYGIGVRSGCFCAHPYILHLLGLSPKQSQIARSKIIVGDKSDMPGMVRASIGLYNTREDIDKLVYALTEIASGKYQGKYIQDPKSGEYTPEGWKPDFKAYFSINNSNM